MTRPDTFSPLRCMACGTVIGNADDDYADPSCPACDAADQQERAPRRPRSRRRAGA